VLFVDVLSEYVVVVVLFTRVSPCQVLTVVSWLP
jgi:hypothetical protein